MCAKSVSKKRRKKSNRDKIASLAEQNARKSMNRSDRAKQKRQQAEEKLKKIVEKAEVAQGDVLVAGETDETKVEGEILDEANVAVDTDVETEAVETEAIETEVEGVEAEVEKETSSEGAEAVGVVVAMAEETQGEDAWESAVEEVEEKNKRSGKVSEDESKKRRHKLFPMLWWVIGVLVLIAAGVGGFYLAQGLMNSSNIEVSEENEPVADSENETKGDNSEEEPPVTEDPPVEEKPAEEPPVEEKSPVETPVEDLPPIAPRPGNTEQPEVAVGQKVIALTFDDGPSAVTTPRLLDILSGRGVKATFFVLGNMAERSPWILQREVAEGHEVASHTPYHDQLTALSAEQVRWQALEMDRIFTNILGTVPPFTRPPYGLVNDTVREALGQPLIMWSIDPRDWQDRDASIVCSRVVGAAFDGAIILVHDIHVTTVDAVPCIVDNLRAQGYEFLTVSEMAAAKDVPLVNGQIYYSFR